MNVYTATGRLGKDCRTNTVNGTAVCNFPLAVDSGYGENKQTLWFDCALWGKRAEGKLPQYLMKGAQVAVSGELGTREHEGKMYLTLRVSDLDLIGSKPEDRGHAQSQSRDDLGGDVPF